MASSAKHFTFIFFFLSLLSTQLVQARELHSFNKVTPKTNPTTTTTPSTTTTTTTTPSTTTTIPKETIAEAPNTENEPNFTPESQPNYGLFGQDSDNLPPYTTTTTETTTTPPYTTTNVPYKPQVEDEANSNPNYYNKDGYMTETQNMGGPRFGGRGTTNGNSYYNNGGGGAAAGAGGGNNHNVQQQGISGSRALENGKYFYDVQNEKSNNYQRGVYYNDNNNFDQEDFGDPSLMDQGYTTPTTTTTINNHHNYYHGANYQNTQKQGMSDTRFLENGKYYYDVRNEKSYYPNMYPNQNQRGPYYSDNSQLEDFSDPTLMDQGYTSNSNHNNNYYSNGGNYQNTQQHGMSDTRFLENGKYFYDVQNENKYQNSYPDSYDNRGHYGNNENLYENYDSMDGYQNQEQLQDGYGQYDP